MRHDALLCASALRFLDEARKQGAPPDVLVAGVAALRFTKCQLRVPMASLLEARGTLGDVANQLATSFTSLRNQLATGVRNGLRVVTGEKRIDLDGFIGITVSVAAERGVLVIEPSRGGTYGRRTRRRVGYLADDDAAINSHASLAPRASGPGVAWARRAHCKL